MDLSFLLPNDFDISSIPSFQEKEGGTYVCLLPLDDELSVLYTYCDGRLDAEVYDAEGEKYSLFSVSSTPGAFVSKLREDVREKAEELLSIREDYSQRDRVYSLFSSLYGISPDFPFEGDDETAVFRSLKNGKWVGILMHIPQNRLGLAGDKKVYVLNIKAPEADIPSMKDGRNIFTAWHMSKKHWISILVDQGLSDDMLSSLVEKSRILVERK